MWEAPLGGDQSGHKGPSHATEIGYEFWSLLGGRL
jgi:hypothetical protein